MKMPLRATLIVLPITVLASASSAPAQSARYDANCKPITEEDRLAQLEMADTHPIIGVGLKLNDKACGGRNFLVRLFKKERDLNEIDAGDVIEASKPAAATSIPDGMTSAQWKAKQERWRWEKDHPNWRAEEHAARMRNTNAANDESNFPEDRQNYVIIPPTKPDGFLTIFQAKAPEASAPVGATPAMPLPTLNDVQGEGTLLSPTGIARGMFNKGKLQGRGEEVLPDGTWRGGEYKDGKINGEGFELREENGQPTMTEGTFADDKPDGTVSRTYVNGNMRRALWSKGEQIAEGALASAGTIPPEPIYKSPAQLAAEADADFETQLASAPTAAGLFAMADELSEKGENAKARRAYRALMTRFPTSPLADRAAGQLSQSGPASLPVPAKVNPGPAMTAKYSSLCTRDAAKVQDFASTHPFQSAPQLSQALQSFWDRCRTYDSDSAEQYQFKLDEYRDGTRSGAQPDAGTYALIAEVNRALSDPNYSASYGSYRSGPGGVGSSAQSTTQAAGQGVCQSGNGVACFDRDFNAFQARYPLRREWGMNATYRYSMFGGKSGLEILEKYKPFMSAAEYQGNRNALQNVYDTALQGCRQTSSDGGASCEASYPN